MRYLGTALHSERPTTVTCLAVRATSTAISYPENEAPTTTTFLPAKGFGERYWLLLSHCPLKALRSMDAGGGLDLVKIPEAAMTQSNTSEDDAVLVMQVDDVVLELQVLTRHECSCRSPWSDDVEEARVLSMRSTDTTRLLRRI